MVILGIETSCDETGAAVVEKTKYGVRILSNVVASSVELQAKYGGVIPEQAAREQLKSIIPVIAEALIQANLYPPSSKHHLRPSTIYRPAIDAIAVTQGPGLIGSLLVGVETAKTLALVWNEGQALLLRNKPLVPVNHLLGHFYGNWIDQSSAISYQLSDKKLKKSGVRRLTTDDYPKFPCIGLLVSGGHTDLVLFKDHGKYNYLGGTRDDAAGECFDKCARLLGLPYPGGADLANLAEKGNPRAFNLPRPMINSGDFDFSFSGLKTAVANQLSAISLQSSDSNILSLSAESCRLTANLAASIQAAIVGVLVTKTVAAAQKYKVDQIIVAGGVAANEELRQQLQAAFHGLACFPKVKIFIPPPKLCTDNAAMIAAAACYNYCPINPLNLQADPNLALAKSDLALS